MIRIKISHIRNVIILVILFLLSFVSFGFLSGSYSIVKNYNNCSHIGNFYKANYLYSIMPDLYSKLDRNKNGIACESLQL